MKKANFPLKDRPMSWNPEIYLTFADQRTRPAAELLGRVRTEHPDRVIDLGCGPGNSTGLLAARWPRAQLEGLDSSAAMLAEARASGVPATWVEADLAGWTPAQPYDVIFSNATLQWVAGQETLLPRLMGFVKSGGIFAFQVPVNFEPYCGNRLACRGGRHDRRAADEPGSQRAPA